ncbi:MAG: hypothetical protein C0501_15365 [Isosphaera sp.]|nr:hypothetical protein [Isosphaera sp.]
MPSPFPGMDPWVEAPGVFPDLHSALIIYLREGLNAAMPDGYVATSSHLVWVDPELRREPDVAAFGPPARPASGAEPLEEEFSECGMVAVASAPVAEPHEEPYLEIFSDRGDRLVTVVEVLSLSNKRPGDGGRTSYQQKQGEFRLAGVNLVEIDLLRGGPHTTAVPLRELRHLAGRFDYHVGVTVAGSPTRYFARPIRLEERLPTIRVPLDPGVPLVPLDLQPLLDRAYDTGRYRRLVRYDRPCDPPLAPEQQAWAEGVLRGKGLLT